MFRNLLKRKILANYILLSVSLLSLNGCSKNQEPIVEQPTDEFSYEVECTNCKITYTDKSNVTKTVNHTTGKWEYKFDQKISFELKLSIKTSLSSQQTINAYILKNKEAVFGDVGYNQTTITYDTQNARGSAVYGSYKNTDTGNGGNTGGSTKHTSSVCGAKNKSGGYCKHVVVGGGRCWQHR
ncbi:hypothetical protein [Sphingobacterium paramultivorum]|uniref:hypothetical protein n=1 Tax=Sphingobacterium paramultivorum TaxID=2886510 RepID=UPI00129C5075|nr:hypothetical protein [Sphingobacterium paramultivorum]